MPRRADGDDQRPARSQPGHSAASARSCAALGQVREDAEGEGEVEGPVEGQHARAGSLSASCARTPLRSQTSRMPAPGRSRTAAPPGRRGPGSASPVPIRSRSRAPARRPPATASGPGRRRASARPARAPLAPFHSSWKSGAGTSGSCARDVREPVVLTREQQRPEVVPRLVRIGRDADGAQDVVVALGRRRRRGWGSAQANGEEASAACA